MDSRCYNNCVCAPTVSIRCITWLQSCGLASIGVLAVRSHVYRGTALALTGHRAPRYLTIDGRTGLADRMVAAVSGLALAIMTDRAFVMTHHLGGDKVYAQQAVMHVHIH